MGSSEQKKRVDSAAGDIHCCEVSFNPIKFSENIISAMDEWRQIMTIITESTSSGDEVIYPIQQENILHISQAFIQAYQSWLKDPEAMLNLGLNMWKDSLRLWQTSSQKFLGAQTEDIFTTKKKDRRFRSEIWEESALFDFIRQFYVMVSNWTQEAIRNTDGLDRHTAHMVEFYSRQFIDALSPTNFLMTNPEVLHETISSNGENLLRGLRNMRRDIEKGNGKLRISMTDDSFFKLGENIAATKGKVVFQNELMQLIQYEALTDKCYKTPLLIIPAWINKYYILDLSAQNSLVKWLVEQGYTVFIISWVNPTEKLRHIGFDDYMTKGAIAALDAVRDATGEDSVSVMGYCLGGTLLSCTLAYLREKGQDSRIKSATYLTTMVDFSEPGDLGVFIDETQISVVEEIMEEKGYLDGSEMANSFNMLRANDLIWSFFVNNYLLGKESPPFDLLYWNSDTTRMTPKMHSFYLRNMYLNNNLVKPYKIALDGVKIDIRKNRAPCYILSCKEDHIAPWKSTYAAVNLYDDADVTFTLSASGHIAGVVNPPAKKKYCHWTYDLESDAKGGKKGRLPVSPEEWLENAVEHAGSWWVSWDKWQRQFSGKKIPARKIGEGKLKPIEDAPGSYVRVR